MARHQDADWLDPGQLRDWMSLMAMVMTLQAALDAQLKRDAGMNCFEYLVLAGLSEAPERSLPLSTLAHLAQGSLSRLSHAISRLEEQGWVVRRACQGSGRRYEAVLTDAGWHKIQQTAPGHVTEVRRLVVDAVSAEQLNVLGSSARKVVAVAIPDWEPPWPTSGSPDHSDPS